ncbi:MAG: hypothetical protein OS130_07480 [Thermodesulfobacteriota bacterium]|jgi:hypothetical protein|nr:MAG: hypothetical protein OS130_07480 [Thermodesulfobacteriota bacterium]
MTGKEFINAIANGETDIIQELLDITKQTDSLYCVVGGLAVNAYVEPVVSLDLDVVVIARNIELVCEKSLAHGFKIERFQHSINLNNAKSELRIQLQTDARYQEFINHATKKNILGYDMQVAQIEDVLRGKIWAFQDETRRKSKRQKDLADIIRLVEEHPDLMEKLPDSIRKLVE